MQGPNGAALHTVGEKGDEEGLPSWSVERFAFVFPGQGSQRVGMGAELVAHSPAAAEVFRRADAALGEPLSQLAFLGPADLLDQTVNAQPALLAASLAYLAAIREAWREAGLVAEPAFVAGHSMGQYTALVAAGSLDLETAVRLVRQRGAAMQSSGAGREGRMVAIIGLPEERIGELLTAAAGHGEIGLANRNAPGQIVLSGVRAAVEAAAELAPSLGARRAVVLPVSVAAHSPLMAEAQTTMAAALAAIEMADPHPPLLANGDGELITTGAQARRELVQHLTGGVDWVAVVERLAREGVETVIEVGPGRVLTGLVRRIAPQLRAIATDDPSNPAGIAIPFLVPATSGS